MKKLLFCTTLLLLCNQLFAQEATTVAETTEAKPKYWSCTGILSLNASATGMWNWAAGGNNNATGIASANITLLYKKNSLAWESNLDTEIGVTFLDAQFEPWRKSNDKINFTTKLGWEFHNKLYLTALGSFKSQYARGYEYGSDSKTQISEWLSPSYTDISLGLDYKPNEIFSVYFSPVAGRISTSLNPDFRERYGIAVDKTNIAELGLSAKFGVNYTRIENLKIISTVGLFTPYTWDEDPLAPRRFGNFDVDWDFSISYQFLKVLNVSLNTSLKYYPGVLIADQNSVLKERVQFKSVLGLGVGYSF